MAEVEAEVGKGFESKRFAPRWQSVEKEYHCESPVDFGCYLSSPEDLARKIKI